MTVDEILSLGSELAVYLDEFQDCFGRSEPRGKLATYVRGQLGELPRKSVEPMALAAGIKPRSLQEFLASDDWDEERLQAHTYRLVARDHHDDQLIGVIDESGHPKKGRETAGVSRQYCGNTVLSEHGQDRQLRDDGASDRHQFRRSVPHPLGERTVPPQGLARGPRALPRGEDSGRGRVSFKVSHGAGAARPRDLARCAFFVDHGGRMVLAEARLRDGVGTA